MKQCVPSFAVWLGTRLIATCSAMVLMVSMAERALAIDCLAYKPERAQGQWHADVVSGKICWYGPNWRSFLPKPKMRMESSLPANSKLKMRVVNRKPDTQVVETEVENSKPDVLVESSKPDTQVVKVENSKPNVQIENGKADISVVPTSPLARAADLDRAQESSDSGKPSSVKAAEFTNAVSSEFEPKPAVSNATIPGMRSEPQSITDLLVAFSIIALGTIGLVTLIMRGKGQQGSFYTDIEEQPLDRIPAVYQSRQFAVDGGLMSYGPDTADIFRRSASYVDRILKGAKSADLPVQEPTKYELVINSKTAKTLGLTVPPQLLARRR